ncbi:DUF5110 domain-containing protein [Cellulophaga sp. F20128]|uniref:TIM-barrel domain-containing protein n=1 Tax=Cellulophaga sp. F20128 TaxID=2926413 RepID=UPI001FF3D607|nr:TIM-barrel domain-containing protein [Cellulophaga sp. F20128]MCK0155868.1 DUF5110 domain-containing protein [Cellulophaga sp. F20128]
MHKSATAILLTLSFFLLANSTLQAKENPKNFETEFQNNQEISSAIKINNHTIELLYANKQRLTLDFYSNHTFRMFQDNNGGILRNPKAIPEAQILVDQPRKYISSLNLTEENSEFKIESDEIIIIINKFSGLLKAINKKTKETVLEFAKLVAFEDNKVSLSIKTNADEYFYGGGVQNGRFSHKGKVISIENQNSWTDGGVASPTPFFWSTKGYGILWHTFKKGKYDFGSQEKDIVKLYHETDYLDVFVMLNDTPVSLLNDFYQLTGNPILLPKFGFYQGHLNAYNRDYWKEDKTGILFEDGKYYKESQKDKSGIKESLNGELKNNYQFSARAVIDRYKSTDMPFGWILPNDGYGAGYGQTESLDGNIENLKSFGEYARKNGVEIGLWTQSDLYPKDSISALLQRDIIKEVRDAGVRVLKTDVAWVGPGYSFGLNGVADVSNTISYYGNDARPFIISLDGWAGTQRYASIWSGDQTGGIWEYIRFHIPTYIGSGLSGQPNITSDMDGIFGGKNIPVNVRDFQWKTFTPMQLNMDGWGSNIKYAHALGEPATSINRNYLKLKSELMPYAYSIAKEAIDGKPMIRALFLDYPNSFTYGIATQYQFLYGPSFLVAPIYQDTKSDALGNDIRNGIYLPEGIWYDYFTGEKYKGNRVINSFDAPLWKLPLFVKAGGIIPLTRPNNNTTEIPNHLRIYEIYPYGKSSFLAYDDDGKTEAYKIGKGTTTRIESSLESNNQLLISIFPTQGSFDGLVTDKSTEIRINATSIPKKIKAKLNGKTIKLTAVNALEELQTKENVFFYDKAPEFNKFSTAGTQFATTQISRNPQIIIKLARTNTQTSTITVQIDGFNFEPKNKTLTTTGPLTALLKAEVTEDNTEAYSLKPSWNAIDNADYYEIEFNNMLYTMIKENAFVFDGLTEQTDYDFKLRAVNKDGHSNWVSFHAKTKSNPLEFAIKGIEASLTAADQPGSRVNKLFDFDENNTWHTKWGTKAVPFTLIADLKSYNVIDKIHYLPRSGGGNGVLLKGTVYSSDDHNKWTKAGSFDWDNDGKVKEFVFQETPTARYIKFEVTDGKGDFGSGRELYIFKVKGTESYIPGDINNDKIIDANDFTSYMNYTGLRLGDSDYDGYVGIGDINKNNLIDAYDISVVGTQLEGGVSEQKAPHVAGKIVLSTDKKNYAKGETISITVKGINLKSVNAISLGLPYDGDYEYMETIPLATKTMENLTYDRRHTNGTKSLYPTFINIGNKTTIEGNTDLFRITFKAKRALKFNLKGKDGILVDTNLKTVQF